MKFFLILVFAFSCSQSHEYEVPIYDESSLEFTEVTISLDDFGDMTSWIYCHFEKDGQSRLAILNNALHSIDVYDLDSLKFEYRIKIEEVGPNGLSEIESIDFENNKFYLSSSVERKFLEIDEDNTIKTYNLKNVNFNDDRKADDIFFNISPEFNSIPLVLNNFIYFPIANQADYSSEAFYKGDAIGMFDLNQQAGVSAFGKWSLHYFGKDMYFGSLGEISLSKNDNGIMLSFPVDPLVIQFDLNGKKISESYFASSTFPKKSKGISRDDNDLQAEDNLLISNPWFLKTIYHRKKQALIRFEKQKQELLDIDGKLNSKLYGSWNLLVGFERDSFKTLKIMKLPQKTLFVPISFPYKNGVLVKKIIENEENFATFYYIEI